MTRADMDKVRDDFVRAAEMAARAGFDWLELHYAHGYLMSAFITPLTNKRTDEYGGSLENRHALSARSLSRRRARSGPTTSRSRSASPPTTGSARRASRRRTRSRSRSIRRGRRRPHRRFGGPDLERRRSRSTAACSRRRSPISIRNEAGIATLAVGNIYDADHVNSILMAGRADLVCLARPHLADPYWTLHAAADARLRRRRRGRSRIGPAATSCIASSRAPMS